MNPAYDMNPPGPTPPVPDIFVLCDEAIVRQLIYEILSRRGYTTRLFDMDQIPLLLEELRAASPRPRLLIAKRMGGLGVSAAQACREIEPGLRVLAMSGFLSDGFNESLQRKVREDPIADAVIPIPFSPFELDGAVQHLLDAPRRV